MKSLGHVMWQMRPNGLEGKNLCVGKEDIKVTPDSPPALALSVFTFLAKIRQFVKIKVEMSPGCLLIFDTDQEFSPAPRRKQKHCETV